MKTPPERFNDACLKYGGDGQFKDLEFQAEKPELYKKLHREMIEYQNKLKTEHESSRQEFDKRENIVFLLNCLCSEDDIESDVIEIDHDHGFCSVKIQDIAKMALEFIED